MRKLIAFEQVTLDGYFADQHRQMSWGHESDPEWDEFVANNAKSGGVLLFGRITYEMMVSFWPTPKAQEQFPEVAEGMNAASKVVFSRTLAEVSWENARLVKSDMLGAVRALKREQGPDLVILGSGSLVTQLTDAAVIDEYRIVVGPLALGSGSSLFAGIDARLSLKRIGVRPFANGNVLMSYARSD